MKEEEVLTVTVAGGLLWKAMVQSEGPSLGSGVGAAVASPRPRVSACSVIARSLSESYCIHDNGRRHVMMLGWGDGQRWFQMVQSGKSSLNLGSEVTTFTSPRPWRV